MKARLVGLTVVAFIALAAPAPAAARLCHGQFSKPVLPTTREHDELHSYARTRAQYGFRHDIAYIQQLIARHQWTSGLGRPDRPPTAAFPAPPAEEPHAALYARLDLGDAGSRYLERHADVSGGYSIENGWPRRPFILVRFTRDVAQHLAALRRIARFPHYLRAKRVPFSDGDLQRIVDRVYKDQRALQRAGFRDPLVERTSVETGRVEISVTTRRRDYRAYFAARYGRTVKVRPRPPETTVYECAKS